MMNMTDETSLCRPSVVCEFDYKSWSLKIVIVSVRWNKFIGRDFEREWMI